MPDRKERSSLLERLDRRLPELYLLLALVLTTLLSIMTAPFFTPDEPHHAARAITLSHGQWMAHFGTEEAGGEMDENVLRVMDKMDTIRMDWEKRSADPFNRAYGPVPEQLQLQQAGVRWAHRNVFAPFPNTALYPPVLYLPAIAGWRIAEAADLTVLESLRLSRLLCAFAAVGLGWVALRLCSCSRWLLLAFLLLPSTLFLDASCSQEPLLLSIACLIAAMLSRPLTGRRDFTAAELAITAALLALCATARPPYIAMTPILFLPLAEMPKVSWRRWIAPAAAFAIVVALCAIWRHMVIPFGVDEPDAADPATQIMFLRKHPIPAAWYVLKGTGAAALDLIHRGLYVVGWNDLLPPHALAILLAVSLAVMLLLAPACSLRTRRGRILLAACVAAPFLGISLAEYVIWTPPGGHVVYGIQPRYWLAVLPLAFLLLANAMSALVKSNARLERVVSKARITLLLSATAVLAGVACTLPWLVAHAFYADSFERVLRLNLR